MYTQESEELSTGNDIDNVNVMLQMLRRNAYYIKKVKKKVNFTCAEDMMEYNYDENKYTFTVINITHCIIIFKKKVVVENLEDQSTEQSYITQIIDSNSSSTLDLTQHNLNWCCGDNMTFNKPQSVYSIEPSKKLKIKLNT